MIDSTHETIRAAVQTQPLVDTHEHIQHEHLRNAQQIDFFSSWLLHYASSDLVSAGMPIPVLETVRDVTRPLDERWALFAPYWEHVRTTGYGRALLVAARDLHDVDDINADTWSDLSARITASNRPGWYREVLRERAGIEVAIADVSLNQGRGFPDTLEGDVDDELFVRSVRFESFIMARSRRDLLVLERATDTSIHSVDDLVRALEVAFERVRARGQMVAVKNALAYVRSLDWQKVSHHEAEVAFRHTVSHADELRELRFPAMGGSLRETKPLQDYMMHQTIRLAIEHGLPMQIHTGLQEGNGNILTNSRPTDLVNLFIEYPEARFDLFHAGYPYTGEVAALAKNFPNVYADLCWVHVISPSVGRRVLREWIETIPANKIFAFGGDYLFVEGAYAHAKMAREGIARTLSEMVDDGYFGVDDALAVARKVLHDNAWSFFRLGERWRGGR
jgi:uncharacterized protein